MTELGEASQGLLCDIVAMCCGAVVVFTLYETVRCLPCYFRFRESAEATLLSALSDRSLHAHAHVHVHAQEPSWGPAKRSTLITRAGVL